MTGNIPPPPEFRRRTVGESLPEEEGIDIEKVREITTGPKRRHLERRKTFAINPAGKGAVASVSSLFDRGLSGFANWFFNRTQFGQYRQPPLRGTVWWRPRWWIYRLSGGCWNFGATRSQRDAVSKAIVTRRLDRCLSFMSFSRGGGGVGKTITADSLAQTLAAIVPDAKTLLVDKHPIGSIETVTGVRREDIACVQNGKPEEACFTLPEAYQKLDRLTSEAAIRWRFPVLSGTGLYVLTYPEETRLEPHELLRFKRQMERFFSFIVFDSDPDDGQEDTKALLESVDAVAVITKRRNVNRVEQAAKAIKAIQETPAYNRGRDRVVFVVNQVWLDVLHWWGTTRTVKMLSEALGTEYKGSVATLPSNFLISTGRKFLVVKRSARFRRHALELAARLIEKAVNPNE